MTPASCRWSRFSLRTLFVVVTMAACWLGSQLDWIRQRRAAIDDEEVFIVWWAERPIPPVPVPLRIFGERGYAELFCKHPIPASNGARLRRLFPEAAITGTLDE